MNCGEFESRLNDWLDGLQPELSFAAAAHARRCAKCGELLAGHEMLLAGLHALPLPEPSADFSFRVLDEVAVRRPQPALTPVGWAASAAAWVKSSATWAMPVAAAMLVAVVSLWRSWLVPVGPGASEVAGTRSPDVAKSPRYVALLRETGLAGAKFTKPAWIGQVTDGLKPLPSSVGAVLMAQPLTSPMGAALLALNSTAPGA
jgi:hypothetical protein